MNAFTQAIRQIACRFGRFKTDIQPSKTGLSYAFDPTTGVLTIAGEGTTVDAHSVCNAIKRPSPNDKNTTLKQIDFNGSTGIKTIAHHAFRHCLALTTLSLPEDLTVIGNFAFYGCTSITTINFSTELITIGNSAFTSCCHISSLTLPPTLTTIGSEAFFSCSGISSLNLPTALNFIGYKAFCGCKALYALRVDPSNSTFCTIDGVVYSKDKTKLILCPQGKKGKLTLPDEVTEIGERAFHLCRDITSLTLPNELTTIGIGSFYYCNGLTTIEIPKEVTTIGTFAFYGCGNLSQISCHCTTEPAIDICTFAFGSKDRTLLLPFATHGFGSNTDNKWGASEVIYGKDAV